MISEIYDALASAASPEDKARRAAEAVARDDRLGKIDDRLLKIEERLTKAEGESLLIKWMMGFVLAFQVAIFTKLFFH